MPAPPRPAPTLAHTGHRPELDGVRALAVLAVVAGHVGYGRLAGGWVGVGVFFVLSGYLITSILVREWQATGAVSLRRFYLRRLLRLYPALVLLLVLCAAFAPVFGDGGTAGGYAVTAAATGLYVQDFVMGLTGSAHGAFRHTWSLAVEEQFYLLWPLVLPFLLRRGRLLAGALAGVGLSWLLLAVTTAPGRGADGVPATYALPHTRAGELLLGCALAAWLATGASGASGPSGPSGASGGAPRRLPERLGWLAPAGLAGLAVTVPAVGKLGGGTRLELEIPLVALLGAALVLGLVVDPRGATARLLGWGPLAWVGRVSYGVYLFHLPVIVLVDEYLPGLPWAAKVVLEVVLTLAVSAASYRFVERPCLRLKDRWAPAPRAATTPSAPQPAPATAPAT